MIHRQGERVPDVTLATRIRSWRTLESYGRGRDLVDRAWAELNRLLNDEV